jgi:hypothetical protein
MHGLRIFKELTICGTDDATCNIYCVCSCLLLYLCARLSCVLCVLVVVMHILSCTNILSSLVFAMLFIRSAHSLSASGITIYTIASY